MDEKKDILMDTYSDEVKCKASSRSVWLVKIPSFLYDAWTKVPTENMELGKVKIERTGHPHNITMLLADSIARSSEPPLPKKYELKFSASPDPTQILTEDEEGIEVIGTVKHKVDVKPVADGDSSIISADYRKLVKARTAKSIAKPRNIHVIDLKEVSIRPPPQRITSTAVNDSKRKRVSPPRAQDKRERKDKNILLEEIFHLFEKKTHYTLKELLDATKQPPAYLKETLNEVCNFIKKGQNKSTYELKPEHSIQPITSDMNTS